MITFKAKDKSGEIIKSALSPFTFPAGEAHIKMAESRDLESTEIAIIQPDSQSIHDDLFQLAMWNDYLKRENWDRTSTPEQQIKSVLILPYMPGARADRGLPFGLSVYANFIHSLELDQIIIFDPHSGETGDQLHAASNALTILRPSDLFRQPHLSQMHTNYVGIIAPDKGAVTRAQGVADAFNLPLYTAEKTRDFGSGKLSGFSIDGLPEEGTLLVVDDICDGGGTFIGLSEASRIPRERMHLYVSHGVFSKDAVDRLPVYFEQILTTNSYNPTRDLNETVWMDYVSGPFNRMDVVHLMLDRITL